MRDFSNRIGEKFPTKYGGMVEIIEYFNSTNCTLKAEDGSILKNKQYSKVKNGDVGNSNRPSVLGMGYIGDCKVTNTRIMRIWKGMFERSYSEKWHKKFPTYKDCSVAPLWLSLENFAKWYEENFKSHMQEWELDKDILIKGNKIYSPETCCFVPKEINYLFTKSNSIRGDLPIGVRKVGAKFQARVSMYGKSIHIGSFYTAEEAFRAYKIAKEEYIKEVADLWRGQITEPCYYAMYNYKVEITD